MILHAIDFVYDGKHLSDFGFVLCHFSEPSSPDIVSAGSQITFDTVSIRNGKYYSLTGSHYDECLSATFDICRNPCSTSSPEITSSEYRELVRWLNRKQFLQFGCIDPNTDSIPFYCDGTFNIQKIFIDGFLYGLELTLTTNRPFCYGEQISKSFNITTSNSTITIDNESDETGYLYPDISITCNSTGDLSIENTTADCSMIIRNCSSGEKITQYGDSQIITSSLDSHELYNDFNFSFFRLTRTYDNMSNSIKVSLPCSLSISYYPIIKESM